ncbi:hypothetical protein TNCV_3026651 [Trichonephila clavipes]|nr:hypothetical protein TNCV_3026651 [Trichonephila clavipes]
MDFHDAENRQRPCRMIMRHVKNLSIARLAWVLSAKLSSLVQFRIVRAQVAPSGGETGRQNYAATDKPIWYRSKK